MDQIEVSIICNVYNHEKYIKDALEGFVMQKTNFAYEILVHDDASTDRSADIIREYEAKYPEIIKPIYQTVNQYSKGIDMTRVYQLPRVKGKYIAFCEGDDYWTDPQKLQKQFDAMEGHPEVDICAHAAVWMEADTGKIAKYMAPKFEDTVISAEEVIYGDGAYVATNSLFYRTELNSNIPQFRRQFGFDYALQIHGSLRGGMLYLNDCMSVYRRMTEGSWTARVEMDDAKRHAFYERKQNMLQQLDKDTQGKYNVVIQRRIFMNEFAELKCQHQQKVLLEPKYKNAFLLFSKIERLKLKIKIISPWLEKIYEKLYEQRVARRIRQNGREQKSIQ